MAGTITFSGLSSGLDTTSWIESLVSVKSTTVTSLQEEQKLQQELLNVVNGIKSYFSSFQSALQKITDSQFGIPTMDLFMQNLAISSNSNIVTATATTEAARQSYDILVDQLATSTKATSGQKEITTQYATLNTKLGVLGVKNGTITVDSKSFNISQDDTIKTLIQKFSDVGVVASFDDKKSTFTVNTSLDKIDDGTTGLKNALKLQNNSVSGVISGSLVYADRDSKLSKLGVTAGNVKIEGVVHTITKSGDNYTIKKSGSTTATTINTLGQFLDYLKGSAVKAEEATVDDNGNITIRGAVIESVSGGSNIKDALKLGDVIERTIMESQNLTYQQGHFADLTSTLEDLGITSNKTLVIGGTSNTLTKTSTLQNMKNLLAAKGVDMSIDSEGVITIDTNGVSISGTILSALGLEVNKGGTTLTSGSHTVTYKAKGDTLLSELGVTSSMSYKAYKSDGTKVGEITGNNQNLTLDDFINQLKGFGLNASFDSTTHQITIDDGYIDGTLANKLGMTSKTDYYQEAATTSTTLEKLGAVATQTLIIDGAVKNYSKTTTLNTVIQDITNAGGVVDFDDGIMTVSGVTLSGSLTGLLGFEATSQGTTITSGGLSIVTNSSSTSTGGVQETTDNDIKLTSKIGDITGTTTSYTLSINGGTSQTITKDSTLQTISNLITAQGGKFKINDDNTISIEGVKLSGSLVAALGLASVGQGTQMSSGTAITVGGVENVATADNTLKDLGATSNQTLIINRTTKTYANTTKLSTVINDIKSAGGVVGFDNGMMSVSGVTLSGTLLSLLGFETTIKGSSVTSGALSIVTGSSSTGTGAVNETIENNITLSSKIGDITGTTSNYTLSINGGTSQTITKDSTLQTISNLITAQGGTFRINADNTITIKDVNISGTLLSALGFESVGQGTEMTSNTPIVVGGAVNIATVDNTLKDLGVTGTKSLVIDGVTKNYANTTKISAIFADIQAAGGTAKIEDGIINIQGVTLGGDIVDIFKLNPSISGTSISSGALSVVKSNTSTSSSALNPTRGVVATMSTKLGDIKNIGTPTLAINNGAEKTYQLTDTLETIKNDIQAAGGIMTIDVNGKISIEGVNISGSLVNTFGFSATGQSTIISSNDPVKVTATGQSTSMTSNVAITMQEEKYVTGDTYIDYIVNGGSFASSPNSSDYSYELYDTYGNIIMSTSSSGTYVLSGTQNIATIDTWITEINNTMNAYYGTVGLTYARLMNNGITIEKGYVAGTLPGELGITTSSSLAGIQIQGTKLVYGASGEFINNPTIQYEADSLTKVETLSDFASSGIYGIYDVKDLQKLAELVNAGKNTSGVTFVLKNDIDMSGVSFTPIGTYYDGTYFKGTFYGNGHTISNLTINYKSPDSYGSEVGLFGRTKNATIQDLGLSNVSISDNGYTADDSYIGALIGNAVNSTITNCFVNGGTVTSAGQASNYNKNIGGLIGRLQSSDINYSYSTATVTGSGNNVYAGGLVGYSISSSSSNKNTISNSYASGDVTISNVYNIQYLGGFVGYSQNTNYSNSYSRGNVRGHSRSDSDYRYLGSFAGYISYDSFNNVYSMGSVTSVNAYASYDYLGSFYAKKANTNTFTNTVYNALLGLVKDRTTAQTGLEGWSPSQIEDENNTLPKLQLRNPNENTSLSMMGLTTEADRTLTMTVGATMYTKIFDADDTIKDVITYMNALPGTTATFEDSTLKVSTTSSSELKVGGNLGDFLLSEEAGSQFIYQTENNDKELKYLNKNKKVNNNTTMAELLGNTSGGTLKILINDSQQVNLTYSATDTIQNVLDDLMMNGIDASISSSGVFTATSDNKVSLSGSVAHALLGDSPTVQYTANGTGLTLATPGDRIDTILNGGTTSSNSSDYSYVIYDSAGNIIQAESTNGTYNMSGSQNNATFNDWISAINNAMNSYYGTSGVTYAAMRDSVLEITGGYVSGNLPNGLGITTKPSVTTTVSGTSITYEKPVKFIGTTTNFTAPDDAVRVSDVTGNDFTSGKTYLISDASDLKKLATKVNAGGITSGANFVLTTDIDMSGVAKFTPIGNSSRMFQGNFYGNGHTISNLTINVSLSSNAYTGLFGITDGAVIRDVGLENVSVTNKVTYYSDDAWTGALVGYALNTTISNVYVDKGSVQSNHSDYCHQMYTGGLVGQLYSGKIEYSYSTVNVVADNSYNNQDTCTGGLVGFNSGQIFDSYATGNVSVYSDLYSSSYHVSSGGFVGYNTNLITRSFSTGQVTVSGNNVNKIYTGGFVGWNYSAISNSYSLGRPQANKGAVGAFAGQGGTYNNCYYNTESGFTGGNSFMGITGKTQAEILADPTMPQLVGYQTTNILATHTLSEIGLTIGSQRALMLNINGSSYLKEFNADDTVQTVVDYLNSFSGVSASFENSKLVVKVGDSQDISMTGDIATRLLGGSGTYTQSTGTANAANRLYYAKLSSATRVGDLLGTNQAGELKLLIDGTQYVLNYDANDTMRDIMDDLQGYGINSSITSDGVFTLNSTKNISLLGDIGHALLGSNYTTSHGSNKYTSESVETPVASILSNSTTLKELDINSGTIQVINNSGGLINTISIDNTKTISQIESILSAYGFNMSLDTSTKKVTITSNSQYQLADGTSNLVSGLKLNVWTPNTDKVDANTTLDQLGFNNGSTFNILLDGTTQMNFTFGARNTIQDIINSLSAIGINASIDSSGVFTASSNAHSFIFTGDLASALTNGTTGYQNIIQGYESYNPLTYMSTYQNMSENTTVADLLSSTAGGTLRVILDGDQVINLDYKSTDTLKTIMNDLAALGINAEINSGVFSATSTEKSFTFAGNIGNVLQGNAPTYNTYDSEFLSDELSYNKSVALNDNSVLKGIGVSSGQVYVLDTNGDIINSIDISDTMTIAQTKAALKAYGFNMSVDGTGKVTISSAEGYSLIDGSSDLISKFKLSTWNKATSKLTTSSTLAQMGFKDGATLTVVLDGVNTMQLSFSANNNAQDIINALSTLNINASIDSNGKFSANSNSHSFMFTGDLASFLTKGNTGYTETNIGFETKEQLKYNTNTTTLKSTTTIEDLLGVKQDGTLRITFNNKDVMNLDYKSNDTVQSVLDDLANLGINATISSSGVFSATSKDDTFILSGSIGQALQGNNPTYTNFDNDFVSEDLSYQKTNVINNNSILNNIGITNGQIYVVDAKGNVINSIDIDNTMTVEQIKNSLVPYGFNMSVDSSGKVTISSTDGYSLKDGSSNMVSKFKLSTWNKTTSKLTTNSTLAQMGFKDGANLNILLDGTETKVLSFGANETVQDIINSLQALGIQASINNTNGAFSASSTEHSFIFNGDLAQFLTSGSAGYVNADKNYVTKDKLLVDIPYVTNTSPELKYTKNLQMTDTVESMGFKDGGVIRLTLDGNTQYSLSFLASDTMQDIADAFAVYGVQVSVGANGKLDFRSDDHEFALGGALGNYLVQGGVYNNKDTGYISDPLSFNTTENIDLNTKLSSLGVSNGYLNIVKDNEIITSGIYVDETITIGQLFSAIKVYGIDGSIITRPTGETYIQLKSDGDLKLVDGTSDVVQKLGLNIINQGDYDSEQITYWDTNVPEGLITEDMLLSNFDKNGFTAAGSLIFKTGSGDDEVEHIVNISASDTVGDLLKKLQNEGVNAVLQDGLVRIDNGINGISFTGGTSGLLNTLNLATKNVDTYASSSSAITYEEEVISSVANFADGKTLLSTVNVTDGNLSIYVDGVKATVVVNSTDTFENLFDKIVAEVAAKTGKTIKAGFLDADGNIVKNPTTDKNTGIVALQMVGGEELVIGASNDTTNFATIANLSQKSDSTVEGTRALYKVNINSLVTGNGLFKEGNITEGTFTIGDATFTIDSTTTLNSLIKQINASDKAYASAYWDTLSGTLVLQSTLTGESLINIEGGTSNFTDIMGFTETVNGVESLVTSSQTLGKNAIVRINGTTVTSSSNVITSDISKIKGLTLNLKGLSNGESTTITVEQDDDSIYNAVSDIVDSYNTLMEGIEKELSGTTDLAHDTMLKLIKNNIKRLVTSSLAGSYTFKNLAAIGITTGEASNDISTNVTALIIDKDKFMQALDDDSDSVRTLLSGTSARPGILLQIGQIVDSALSTAGYIGTTENRINKNISNLQDKITAQTAALAKYRERLEARFSLMESVISNMQNSYVGFLNK